MNLDVFMDKLGQMLMSKWNKRRKIGRKLQGLILPQIIKELNEQSREVNLEVEECSEEIAEVTTKGGSGLDLFLQTMAGSWDSLQACTSIHHIP